MARKKNNAQHKDSKGLTPKQSRFVAEYLKDLNATQAAIRAGYSANGAGVAASRLLANVKVAASVAQRQVKVAAALDLTVEGILQMLKDDHRDAKADGQHGPAIKAAELLGKHLGMFEDRMELSGPGGGPIRQAVSRDDLDELPDDDLEGIANGD